MKTILWATLTANGNYAQSGPENPPKKEALEDFTAHAKAAGIGRRSFEGMVGNGGGGCSGNSGCNGRDRPWKPHTTCSKGHHAALGSAQ